jgi:hypothetical protein
VARNAFATMSLNRLEDAIASGHKADQRRKVAELMEMIGRADRCP